MSDVNSKMVPKVTIDPRLLFRLIIGGDFAKLREKGFVARKGLSPIPITFPMIWRSKDSNVEFNLHAWRFLSAAWAYYIKNQNYQTAKEVFDFSTAVAKDWINFLKIKKSKYAWYDMAVGIRAMHIAFMKYLCSEYDAGKWEGESLIDQLAEEHITWLSIQSNITKGNHAIYQIVGLRILEFIYGKPSTDYTELNMLHLIREAFDEEFVGTENSPFYHKYNIDIFERVPIILFPGIKDKLDDLFFLGPLITKWLTAPDGFFYRVGDTEGTGVKLLSKDIEKDFPNEHLSIYKDLGSSGYQVVRSHPKISEGKSFSLLFRGGPSSYVHSHCDALSLMFFHNGEEIFSDAGKFTYDYGEERDWFISDKAHCTVGLKGQAFYPKDVEKNGSKISPVGYEGERYILSGQVVKGAVFNHNRNIYFSPGKSLIVSDICESNSDKNIEVRLILGRGVSYIGAEKGFIRTAKGNKYKVTFSGDIVCVDVFQPEDERAWVSDTYHHKEAVSLIVITCSKNNASISMKLDFS